MATHRINYLEGETAGDFLGRLMDNRKKHQKMGETYSYYLYEFPQNELIDNTGAEIPCRRLKVPRDQIDGMIKEFNKKLSSKELYIAWLMTLERKMGIPAIAAGKLIEDKIFIRPLGDIADKLNKYRRRAKYEMKAIQDIYPADEPQNPKTVGALGELNWLFNNGNNRKCHEVADRLWKYIVHRERDKLFYYTRHPHQPSLHKCQDVELMSRISALRWAIFDKNPFVNGVNYGGRCAIF